MEEKKESAFNRIFKRLTPERCEELRQERLKYRASLSLAYQLGNYVGEEIVNSFLPTLSVDSLQTRTNISVTCAEGDECRRLNNVWFSKVNEARTKVNQEFKEKGELSGTDYIEIDRKTHEYSAEEWKALRAYHEMLEEKYLPKTVECHFRVLNISEENMKEFKRAIGDVLWNCDCSHYSTEPEDIEVKADEDGYFTVITIKKAIDSPKK